MQGTQGNTRLLIDNSGENKNAPENLYAKFPNLALLFDQDLELAGTLDQLNKNSLEETKVKQAENYAKYGYCLAMGGAVTGLGLVTVSIISAKLMPMPSLSMPCLLSAIGLVAITGIGAEILHHKAKNIVRNAGKELKSEQSDTNSIQL